MVLILCEHLLLLTISKGGDTHKHYCLSLQAESDTITVQEARREKQKQLLLVQNKLRSLSAELEKVSRGEERYLTLLTHEYSVIKEENLLNEEIRLIEQDERGKFAALSSVVRESHEKERARTERTKYWSVIGSIVGAIIGILGTSINNYLRMRELRGIVSGSAEGSIELRGLVTQLSDTMKNQHNHLRGFVRDIRALVPVQEASTDGAQDSSTQIVPVLQTVSSDTSLEQLEEKTKAILDVIQSQDGAIQKEMQVIKELLAVSKAVDSDGNVVYVGPAMEDILENTEKNIEWRMKINALWTVTLIYGAFALTLPALYTIFKGS